ncbi:EAL domain-containing protein [Pseudoduganella dura]|uniref:EAL domain-containing protein n=1 Tax=Pseudoduganella dura TaxID=321982 RepID=UPI003FCE7FB2
MEVTESCVMRDLGQTQSVLRSLNDRGISTSLDDFGAGYSSLSYLRQLPLQCLKIDQSFVQTMLTDPNAGKLTQAIIAMGIALDMVIVAEAWKPGNRWTGCSPMAVTSDRVIFQPARAAGRCARCHRAGRIAAARLSIARAVMHVAAGTRLSVSGMKNADLHGSAFS